jgi:hypothetical protein
MNPEKRISEHKDCHGDDSLREGEKNKPDTSENGNEMVDYDELIGCNPGRFQGGSLEDSEKFASNQGNVVSFILMALEYHSKFLYCFFVLKV